jgi:hypothetical protein
VFRWCRGPGAERVFLSLRSSEISSPPHVQESSWIWSTSANNSKTSSVGHILVIFYLHTVASLRNSVRTAGRIPRLFHPLSGDTRRSSVYRYRRLARLVSLPDTNSPHSFRTRAKSNRFELFSRWVRLGLGSDSARIHSSTEASCCETAVTCFVRCCRRQ